MCSTNLFWIPSINHLLFPTAGWLLHPVAALPDPLWEGTTSPRLSSNPAIVSNYTSQMSGGHRKEWQWRKNSKWNRWLLWGSWDVGIGTQCGGEGMLLGLSTWCKEHFASLKEACLWTGPLPQVQLPQRLLRSNRRQLQFLSHSSLLTPNLKPASRKHCPPQRLNRASSKDILFHYYVELFASSLFWTTHCRKAFFLALPVQKPTQSTFFPPNKNQSDHMVQVNSTFGELDKNVHRFKTVAFTCPLAPLLPEYSSHQGF